MTEKIIAEDNMNNNFDKTEKLFWDYFGMMLKVKYESKNSIDDRITIKISGKNGAEIFVKYESGAISTSRSKTGKSDNTIISETTIPGYDEVINIQLIMTKDFEEREIEPGSSLGKAGVIRWA